MLMTSAPRSPSIWPQNGPAKTREASSTRTPANGAASLGMFGLVKSWNSCRGYCRRDFRGITHVFFNRKAMPSQFAETPETEADRLRSMIRRLLEEVIRHNADYKHMTPQALLDEAQAHIGEPHGESHLS